MPKSTGTFGFLCEFSGAGMLTLCDLGCGSEPKAFPDLKATGFQGHRSLGVHRVHQTMGVVEDPNGLL